MRGKLVRTKTKSRMTNELQLLESKFKKCLFSFGCYANLILHSNVSIAIILIRNLQPCLLWFSSCSFLQFSFNVKIYILASVAMNSNFIHGSEVVRLCNSVLYQNTSHTYPKTIYLPSNTTSPTSYSGVLLDSATPFNIKMHHTRTNNIST